MASHSCLTTFIAFGIVWINAFSPIFYTIHDTCADDSKHMFSGATEHIYVLMYRIYYICFLLYHLIIRKYFVLQYATENVFSV